MEITVRRAAENDAQALYTLNREFNGAEGTSSADGIARSLRENPIETVILALVDGTPAGFACGQVHESMCYPSAPGELTELYVREEYRRRGVASRLLDALEGEFRGRSIPELLLVTGADNEAARAFYESRGYRTTGHAIYLKLLNETENK